MSTGAPCTHDRSPLEGWSSFWDFDGRLTAMRTMADGEALWRPGERVGLSLDGGRSYRWSEQAARNIHEANRRASELLTEARTSSSHGAHERAGQVDIGALQRAAAGLGVRQIARTLGIVGVRMLGEEALRARCPIHGGSAASFAMRVRDGRIGWRCFSECADGGDLIDLIQRLRGTSFRSAVREIEGLVGRAPRRAA